MHGGISFQPYDRNSIILGFVSLPAWPLKYQLQRDGVVEALQCLLEAEEQAAPTKESETRTM